jgi:outer membrane protein
MKSMMKAILLTAVAGLCALAQTQKIGVVNMQEALVQTKEGQAKLAELRAKYSPKDQDFQKREQELNAKQDQFRKTQNTISDQAKANLQRDIDALEKGLQRDMDDAKQDMDADEQRTVGELGQKMMQVVQKYAADNQYTFIFDVSAENNNIHYASSGSDVTRDVIALYDKAAPQTPPAAPPAGK